MARRRRPKGRYRAANGPGQVQKQRTDFTRIGVTGLKHFGGTIREDMLADLQGQRGVKTLKEMQFNSAVIAAMLWLAETHMLQVSFPVTSAKKGDLRADECAAFIGGAIDDMTHSPQTMLSEGLTAMGFGWAVLEKVLKTRGGDTNDPTTNSRFSDGRIGWQYIALRSQESLMRWEMSSTDPDKAVAMVQSPYGSGAGATIPLANCVHFRVRENLDNPEGLALIRPCYYPWFYQSNLEDLEAMVFERDGTGLPYLEMPGELLKEGRTPENAALADAMLEMLAQVRTDDRVALGIPASEENGQKTGWKFGLISSPGSRALDIDKTIRRHESRIAMVLLAAFLLLGSDSVGARSLHESGRSTFATSLNAILDKWCITFTKQAIWPLCRMNGFPQETWPKLTHGDVETPPLGELAAVINSMVGANVLTITPDVEAKVREMIGLPQKDLEGGSPG